MTTTRKFFFVTVAALAIALAAPQQQDNSPQSNGGVYVRSPYFSPSTQFANALQRLFTSNTRRPPFRVPTDRQIPSGVNSYFSASAADGGLNSAAEPQKPASPAATDSGATAPSANGDGIGIKGKPTSAVHSPTVVYRSGGGRTRNSYNGFTAKLFQILAARNAYENVVFSPISLQMLLAYISTAARGATESELKTALELADDPNAMVGGFQDVINSQRGSAGELVMANKMYFKNGLEVRSNNAYDGVFNSTSEAISFEKPEAASATINAWVRLVTANRIQSLFQPEFLSPDTHALLVNAIYFKAKWSTPFSSSDTEVQPFYLGRNRTVGVNMMYLEDAFRCGELKELNAKAVELPYENEKMSMLLLLPNELDGLAGLEQKLASGGPNFLKNVINSLSTEPTVTIRLPRFKIEYGNDMVEPLQEMGIRKLFTNEADLGKMFAYDPKNPVGISKIKHKATLTVNEAGSEAAAASFAELIPLSLPPKQFIFTANHPFIFAIHGPDVVYFIGHIVNPLIETY